MGQVSETQVLDKLRSVKDPELHRDIVSLNMVKGVTIEDHTVRLLLELTTPACPLKGTFEAAVKEAVGRVAGVKSVAVRFRADLLDRWLAARTQRSRRQISDQSGAPSTTGTSTAA